MVPSLKMLQVYVKETAAREGEREGPSCPKGGLPAQLCCFVTMTEPSRGCLSRHLPILQAHLLCSPLYSIFFPSLPRTKKLHWLRGKAPFFLIFQDPSTVLAAKSCMHEASAGAKAGGTLQEAPRTPARLGV